jgi:hypothetical protein
MEATCSSEISVDTQWTTWPYFPEHRILQIFIIYSGLFVLGLKVKEENRNQSARHR